MLVDVLKPHSVPFPELHRRYGPLLELVRTLLGVVPNCDPYLEIWPPAFRTYNVMVPNLLNLPFLLWGMGAPRSTVGLAMYVSSRSASCMYCAAHACTFALRRGATVDDVANACEQDPALTAADRAAVRVARQMAVVPAAVDDAARAELRRHFSESNVEWIVLSIAMMGWLNKTMDALGIPLEEDTVAEVDRVIAPSGWTPGQHLKGPLDRPLVAPPRPDSLLKRLSVIRYAPYALKLDKAWTQGVPDRWPAVGEYLKQKTGHTFPILSQLRHGRPIRAIATMIAENIGTDAGNRNERVLDREQKLAAGLIYAECVGNTALADTLRTLGAKPSLPDSPLQRLARAISPSPANVDEAVVAEARTIQPAGVVELVSFIALLQLLNRLSSFYGAEGTV